MYIAWANVLISYLPCLQTSCRNYLNYVIQGIIFIWRSLQETPAHQTYLCPSLVLNVRVSFSVVLFTNNFCKTWLGSMIFHIFFKIEKISNYHPLHFIQFVNVITGTSKSPSAHGNVHALKYYINLPFKIVSNSNWVFLHSYRLFHSVFHNN